MKGAGQRESGQLPTNEATIGGLMTLCVPKRLRDIAREVGGQSTGRSKKKGLYGGK